MGPRAGARRARAPSLGPGGTLGDGPRSGLGRHSPRERHGRGAQTRRLGADEVRPDRRRRPVRRARPRREPIRAAGHASRLRDRAERLRDHRRRRGCRDGANGRRGRGAGLAGRQRGARPVHQPGRHAQLQRPRLHHPAQRHGGGPAAASSRNRGRGGRQDPGTGRARRESARGRQGVLRQGSDGGHAQPAGRRRQAGRCLRQAVGHGGVHRNPGRRRGAHHRPEAPGGGEARTLRTRDGRLRRRPQRRGPDRLAREQRPALRRQGVREPLFADDAAVLPREHRQRGSVGLLGRRLRMGARRDRPAHGEGRHLPRVAAGSAIREEPA